MTPCILNLETSTSVCSVALAAGEEVLFEKAAFEGPSHAALLGTFVSEALAALKKTGKTLDAVAVSSGPGSYTGLRIGVSLAKGLCFGLDIPLIAVPTLDCLAAEAIRQNGGASDGLYCPMLDARRMEVYAALYDSALQTVRPVAAEVIDASSYASFLAEGKVYFFGNGADKCKSLLTAPNACFIDSVSPLATGMVPLSVQAFAARRFENVAYFEPFYLKEFQATVAKNKVLGK